MQRPGRRAGSPRCCGIVRHSSPQPARRLAPLCRLAGRHRSKRRRYWRQCPKIGTASRSRRSRRSSPARASRRMEWCIGVHLGDVLIEDDDILGDGVNIAARLEGIAEPNGICISEDAFLPSDRPAARAFARRLDVLTRGAGCLRVATRKACLPVCQRPKNAFAFNARR